MGFAGDRGTGRLPGVQLSDRRHSEIAKRTVVDAISDTGLSCTPPPGSPRDAARSRARRSGPCAYPAVAVRQALQRGLVDEILVHIVPVLLGGGTAFSGGVRRGQRAEVASEPLLAVVVDVDAAEDQRLVLAERGALYSSPLRTKPSIRWCGCIR